MDLQAQQIMLMVQLQESMEMEKFKYIVFPIPIKDGGPDKFFLVERESSRILVSGKAEVINRFVKIRNLDTQTIHNLR